MMSLRALRAGFFVFFALSTVVAGNLLLLQPDISSRGQALTANASPMPPRLETASLSLPSEPQHDSQSRYQADRRGDARVAPISRERGPRLADDDVRKQIRPVQTGNAAELTRAVQRELKNRGYDPGAQDGRAGLVTRAAILAFQYDSHLNLTASPTEEVLQGLLLGGSGTGSRDRARSLSLSGEARQLVRATQRGLKAQGLWNSSIDGHFSTELSRAIQRFETAQRLPTTGRISGRFMARLVRASGLDQVAAR